MVGGDAMTIRDLDLIFTVAWHAAVFVVLVLVWATGWPGRKGGGR